MHGRVRGQGKDVYMLVLGENSAGPSIHPPTHPFIYLPTLHFSTHPPIYLPTLSPIHPFIYLPTSHLSIHPPTYPFIYLHTLPSIHPPIHPSIPLSAQLPIHLFSLHSQKQSSAEAFPDHQPPPQKKDKQMSPMMEVFTTKPKGPMIISQSYCLTNALLRKRGTQLRE